MTKYIFDKYPETPMRDSKSKCVSGETVGKSTEVLQTPLRIFGNDLAGFSEGSVLDESRNPKVFFKFEICLGANTLAYDAFFRPV